MSIYQRTSRNSAPAQKSAEALGEITVEGRLDSIVEGRLDSIVEGTGVEVACLQGAKGDKGEKGDRGDKGDKGDTPDISAAAQTLPAGSAASVERSGTPSSPIFTFGIPKGDKGDQGPTGEKGEKGDKGDTPNISAASQTLPAGSAASVSRSGTNENPVFTFGIPKGEKGERGEQGESAVTAVENSFIANLF